MSKDQLQSQINMIKREIFRYQKIYNNEKSEVKAFFAKDILEQLKRQLRILIEKRDNGGDIEQKTDY